MKKYILIALSVLLIGGGVTAFVIGKPNKTNSKKSDGTVIPTRNYLEGLREAGFTSLPAFVKKDLEEKRKFYDEKYGVTFFSDKELSDLLVNNGWLIGCSNYYIGDIPVESGKKMIENLKMISEKEIHLDRYDLNQHEMVTQEVALERWTARTSPDIAVIPLVFIAAPKDKFDMSGATVNINADNFIEPKNNDPVALYKINGGWLELARW